MTLRYDWRALNSAARLLASTSCRAFSRSATASRVRESTEPPAKIGRVNCNPIESVESLRAGWWPPRTPRRVQVGIVLIARDGVDGRVVARALPFDFARGDLEHRLVAADDEVVEARRVRPLVHDVRHRRGHGDRLKRRQLVRDLADDLLQRAHRDLERVLARDLLGDREVVARLRLVRVGDGRGPDLEVALRLRELLGDRDLVGADEVEVVLRGEHLEVGLRHAHDEVLRRLPELGLGLQHLELRLLVLDDVLPAEERLREVNGVTVAVEVCPDCRLRSGPRSSSCSPCR